MLRFLLLCLAVWCDGCAWKGDSTHTPVTDERQHAWCVVPVSMGVYPSTRFVKRDGHLILEARIELFDEMGDSTKGVGRFGFELFAPGRDGVEAVGRLLYGWDISILSLEEQQRHYDTITRTYLFRLNLEQLPPRLQRTVLRVIFYRHSGPRLDAKAVIATQRDPAVDHLQP